MSPSPPYCSAARPRNGSPHPVLEWFDHMDGLRGLPVLRGAACQLSPDAGRHLDEAARRLRGEFAGMAAAAAAARPGTRASALLPYRTRLEESGYAAGDAPLLLQMLQCDGEAQRGLLVDLLDRADGPAAGRALAHLALFEPDPDLRTLAAQALASRPPAEARRVLLDAFRHPWPAAADHAADALAVLADRGAVPALVRLLDAPDPAGPFSADDGTVVVREVVRVNHLHNCLLCHAPSVDRNDVARAGVPSPDRPLPPPSQVQSPGSQSPYGASGAPDQMFVRFDVAYLRQDFSLMLDVAAPGLWPKQQQFDFFVRTRPAQADDLARDTAGDTYPQREAVLRALRLLTGQYFGDKAADWRAGLSGGPRL
jgi:hypothetical protein